MSHVDLRQLVGKLNDTSRRNLEAAAGLCLSRTNYNVEIEHWLMKLVEAPNTDIAAILHHFGVDTSHLLGDLTRAIDKFKTGNSRTPPFAPKLVDWIRTAWLIGSIDYGATHVRTGHLLLALLSDDYSFPIATTSQELQKISVEALRKQLEQLTQDSDENVSVETTVTPAKGASARQPTGPTKTPALDQYTINLIERAKQGAIDPVLGRDVEIRQIIDILTRRRQNNPILTGEAGVGKTAVVEGFALRIASGDVPESLRNAAVHTLDLGLLQAGAGVKGEFENRLKAVINEVKASPTPIIMFIDEAHTLIGAGGGAGQGDAANLLKPALARGELRTIAATTWAEYKKYFERDAALARRFQVVKVEEPDETTAIAMMHGLTGTLEQHHGVRILNEAVVDAVKLSSRYISGRQLPDKSVSLLDTTCARIGLSQSATPPAVEDCQRRIDQLRTSIDILNRELHAGADHEEELGELRKQLESAEKELGELCDRWEREKQLVGQVRELRHQLESAATSVAADSGSNTAQSNTAQSNTAQSNNSESQDAKSNPGAAQGVGKAKPQSAKSSAKPAAGADAAVTASDAPELTDEQRQSLREHLAFLEKELADIQGETPLVHPCVTSSAVAETVAAWTGIPVGRMMADEIHTVLNLKQLMEQSIVGQSHALDRIAQSIRTSRANLADPRTPIGVFLLAGTSGVGKTETAITLAELLYGGEQNMTVLNMSEFKEEHKVSLLMGSPPGYVGYGEGGVLTEAVRRKPYSVVLLDEMEKAHPGVQDVFYQVFDKGNMKDGEGRDIDFKNTVILMTTNAGTDLIKSLCSDPDTRPDPDAFVEAVFPELLKSFKPAFLGRVTIIPYYPLTDDVMRKIIRLKLEKVRRRVQEHYRAAFQYTDTLVDTICQRCTEVDTGARNVDHILTRTLLPQMSAEFLSRMAAGGAISSVEIDVDGDGSFAYRIA